MQRLACRLLRMHDRGPASLSRRLVLLFDAPAATVSTCTYRNDIRSMLSEVIKQRLGPTIVLYDSNGTPTLKLDGSRMSEQMKTLRDKKIVNRLQLFTARLFRGARTNVMLFTPLIQGINNFQEHISTSSPCGLCPVL